MDDTTMGNTTSTLIPNQSTPIKHGTSTLLKFTMNHKYRLKEMTDMGDEMKDYIVAVIYTPPRVLLDSCWTPCGLLMDSVWTPDGLLLDSRWTPDGLLMDSSFSNVYVFWT